MNINNKLLSIMMYLVINIIVTIVTAVTVNISLHPKGVNDLFFSLGSDNVSRYSSLPGGYDR